MYSINQLVGNAVADSAIAAFKFVSNGTSDGMITQSANGTASHIAGVSPNYSTNALTTCMYTFGGVAQILAEGSITKGDILTAGTGGGATTLVNAGTIHVHAGGIAIRGAANNDIFPITVLPQDTLA